MQQRMSVKRLREMRNERREIISKVPQLGDIGNQNMTDLGSEKYFQRPIKVPHLGDLGGKHKEDR
jgi:hypothetical protein